MAVLGYLAKLKRDLGLAFGAHFQNLFKVLSYLLVHIFCMFFP